ncbi:MAG: molybdopterin-dependent oxidoreductase, partial [Deferribacterales bacterium]|nr:molybdopterin-dependent oxidoreductase [Deferribacterales bacterium]
YAADAVNADPADAAYADNEEYSFIKEVPVGESLSDYLKGTYTAVTGTDYVNYPYKKYIKDVKDAQWASAITGISADTIKDLAVNIYGKADHKVFTERSYGLQRQYNGIYTYHAIESLIVLSGHFGGYGEGLDYYSKSFDYNEFNPSYPGVSANVPGGLSASCTLWHELCTGAKRFADKDGDLINNLWQLEFDPATNTFAQDGDGNYIAKLDASGNPIKVTPKILFNIAGNMLMNQHMNSNNTKSWVTDKSLVEMIVVYDNFMTSSARYADIVLPGDMNWEREDIGWNDDDDEIMIFASKAINPPGDVRSIHYFGRELAKKLDQLGGTLPTDASIYDKVTFKDKAFSGGKNMTEEEILHHMWNRGNPRWSFEELRRQGIINVNRDGAERTEQKAARDRIRQGLPLRPNSDFDWVSVKGDCNKTGKFHAFASNVVWEFENRGMRYSNVAWQQPMIRDTENDPIAHPVALYIPLEQGFREAGLDFNLDPAAGAARSLLMLSTHSRFRSHSTHNENAWLRDLYKQVPTDDGSTKLANDYLEYANMPADPGQFKTAQGDLETVPNMGEGGYAPIYINKKDADLRGIKNGQKVEVYNTIGKVYAVAHVTEIVIPGVVILFQGSWYDPNSEGIDVGGNPNTLTPDLPSYVDHGNAQNAVAVQVKLAAK